MKLTMAIGFCLLFAWAAHAIGLAPIVGAFAAGLILDEVHFRHFDDPTIKTDVLAAIAGSDGPTQARVRRVVDHHADKHIEHLLEPIGHFLVPLFFVLAGMQVKLAHFADPALLLVAASISLVAILGKLAAGAAAGDADRWLVGWGMVPRGEVGLIFAFVGRSIGVVSDSLFSVIVFVVMATTLATPPVLAWLLRRTRVRHPVPLAAAHGEG
jgi:Kef-type K+ transport system membrane component KefB